MKDEKKVDIAWIAWSIGLGIAITAVIYGGIPLLAMLIARILGFK